MSDLSGVFEMIGLGNIIVPILAVGQSFQIPSKTLSHLKGKQFCNTLLNHQIQLLFCLRM